MLITLGLVLLTKPCQGVKSMCTRKGNIVHKINPLNRTNVETGDYAIYRDDSRKQYFVKLEEHKKKLPVKGEIAMFEGKRVRVKNITRSNNMQLSYTNVKPHTRVKVLNEKNKYNGSEGVVERMHQFLEKWWLVKLDGVAKKQFFEEKDLEATPLDKRVKIVKVHVTNPAFKTLDGNPYAGLKSLVEFAHKTPLVTKNAPKISTRVHKKTGKIIKVIRYDTQTHKKYWLSPESDLKRMEDETFFILKERTDKELRDVIYKLQTSLIASSHARLSARIVKGKRNFYQKYFMLHRFKDVKRKSPEEKLAAVEAYTREIKDRMELFLERLKNPEGSSGGSCGGRRGQKLEGKVTYKGKTWIVKKYIEEYPTNLVNLVSIDGNTTEEKVEVHDVTPVVVLKDIEITLWTFSE